MACVLGYANQIDDGTLSGGSWNASYPITNIKTPYLYQRARTTNTLVASSTIIIDCTTAQTIGVVAIIRHNMTTNGTVRIYGSDYSNFSTLNFDSGAIDIYDHVDWATSFTPTPSRYWKIAINDTGNEAGYIELGRIFLGWQFKPAINIDFGASIGVESNTNSLRALGGPDYFDSRPTRRTWRGEWSWLTVPEALDVLMSIMQSSDIEKEVFLMEDDADTDYRINRWFLCRFKILSQIQWPYLNNRSCGIELVEAI